MEEKRVPEKIDYIIHEGIMVRQERTIKRLWIMCIIIFFALILTNAGWLWYESQFVDEVVTQDVDTGDGTAIVSGIGDIAYGTSKADGQETSTENRPEI